MSDLEALQRDYHAALPGKYDELEAARVALLAAPEPLPAARHLHLLLHRLSGSAGLYGYPVIAAQARALEQEWRQWLDSGSPSRTSAALLCAGQLPGWARLREALRQPQQG